MTTSAGFPPTPPQRPPLPRGVKEAIIAIAALPVLLVVGIYVGGRIGNDSPTSLQPAAGAERSPAPLVTVKPRTPGSGVTGKPAVPGPVVTVKPAAPGPVVTVRTAVPGPVVTVKPATPAPQVTVRPPGPTTSGPAAALPTSAAAEPPTAALPSGAAALPSGSVAPVPPPPGPGIVLGRGSTGEDVRRWQAQMARRTWNIRVDGIFGPETASVARRFQREKGLHVDGLVGPRTWSAAWRLPVTR